MRIGVLGGSFDPVHNAHLIVARLAVEQLGLERVLFVVAGTQPFKQGRHGATGTARLRMVELAVDGIADFVADGRELLRPPPSYTVDTLRELQVEYPDAELVLLMGADVARGFNAWRDPEGVRRLASIATWGREGRTMDDRGSQSTGTASSVAGRTIAVPTLEISSTDIRTRAAAGMSLSGWVPGAVADYIGASMIYRSPAA